MEVKFYLIDIDYFLDDGKSVVRLWGKTEEGKNVVILDKRLYPYFYMDAKDVEDISWLKD